MWQKPWGYKEGFAICGGLFLTGIFLQMTLGKCTLSILSYPVNVCVGLLYVVILLSAYTFSQKSYFIRWMGSCQAAVSSMVSVAVLTVVMGLIRQVKSDIPLSGIENWLGFSQMLSACSFVLLFLWMVTLLGLTTIRRIQRLHMTTKIGQAEWRASDENQKMRELPLAIELQNFTIDEYPPKLMLIDNETGKALPVGKPENLLIEDDFHAGHLLDWEIHIEKKLPLAASVATQDTLNFVDFPSMGAAYAVYLTAVNDKTGRKHEGWVSCGSFMFPYKAIRLDDQTSLVMPEREPRRFASEVKVYTESGHRDSATIEVNKPFELEGWKIYQLSYDESKGRWSDISVFELVRDPWLPVVYTGIWMMIAGAVCLFALSQKRKEDNV